MKQLLAVFANNLLPILLIGGAGYTLGRALHLDGRPFGRLIFYLLIPVLVFRLLTENALPLDRLLQMMGFSAATILSVGGLAYLAGRLFRLDRSILTVVVMTTMLSNTGNYGLPLVSFAFGAEALTYAGVYFVTSSLLTNTLGVFIASLGRLKPKEALLGLVKVPAIYGILLAALTLRSGWTLPTPLARTVNLLADATIPTMLILLGLELGRVTWNRHTGAVALSVSLRLLVGPLLGLGLAGLFHLPPVARQAGVAEAGVPSAVMNTVLASEYQVEPPLVTVIVFVSTLLSPLTLTPLLLFLGK